MSFTLFKEVQVANAGSSTRYGSDDLLDVMRILNGKITSNRRPEILNEFRFLTYIQLKKPPSVPSPTEADVIHLYNDTDNKVKVKKLGGTVVDLEALGTGTWNNTSVETISSKTMNVDANTFKHSISNFVGDILVHDGTRYNRFAKGAALQVLGVNAAGTALEWVAQSGGGGGTGEANTVSNIGTAGIGWFHQKLGIDLQFKKIFSPTGSITITDNVANERIDLELGASVAKTTQSNIWGDFNQEFRSGRMVVKNPLNTFGYFLTGSAITLSRNLILPLLTADDTLAVLALGQTFLNKTFTTGNIFQVDTSTIQHSTSNINGEILVNNGVKFAPFPRGSASQHLRMNASGSGLEWFTEAGGGGGIRLPADNSPIPNTGRIGIFWGGGANGFALLSFIAKYKRLWGSTNSSTEAVTELYTDAITNDVAEYKTPLCFRRDMNCIFKLKWEAKTTSAAKVKIGLSSSENLPAGGGGGLDTPVTRYDVIQNSATHMEFDGGISRLGVRFNTGAPGLNEVVTEVLVRFRKYGTPSGAATVGVRKNSDGSLVTLGSFTPNSFGSGEQTTIISAGSNTYQMQVNDRVTVEFPSNTTDGLELDEDTTASPSGFTSQSWNGSTWATTPETIALRIKTAPVLIGGGSGDTPLNSANGIMIHGSFGTHLNYQIARNNGAASQVVQDSTKPLPNTSTHTAEININTTNIIVIIDGTSFTYTTNIPSLGTEMAFFFHIEAAAAAEKGLGLIYGQVTTA